MNTQIKKVTSNLDALTTLLLSELLLPAGLASILASNSKELVLIFILYVNVLCAIYFLIPDLIYSVSM